MKAIKINSKIKLKSGVQVSSGAIVVINQFAMDNKSIKNDLIPCQIVTNVYSSIKNYSNEKQPLRDIEDFKSSFVNILISISDYETMPSQDLLINSIKVQLEKIYPEKIEIIIL